MATYSSSYEAVRQSAAFKVLSDWCLIKVFGADAASFLQGQSSNDVKALESGTGQINAFLDPKAKIRALTYLYRLDDTYYLLLERAYAQSLYEHLDKYIIMDDVELAFVDGGLTLVAGAEACEILGVESQTAEESVSRVNDQIHFQLSLTGEDDVIVLGDLAKTAELTELDDESFEKLRVEAGVLLAEKDYDQSTLFPETALQTRAVSYTKGCFVGQEIVARVKYRGAVNKLLTGLIFDEEAPAIGSTLETRGKKAGVLKSVVYSELLQKKVAIASLMKNFRTPGSKYAFEADGNVYKAEVAQLPFYQKASDVEVAQSLFDEAVVAFAQETEEGDSEAVDLLKQALHKNAKFADAYEVLGVILSRQERFDEAIELMKQLKELTPDEVMPYTNLSLFYMKKGMIQEAEDEKQQATLASFRKAASDRKKRIAEEEFQKAQQEEIKKKMGMFEQVLEIDEDDLVANFGMGKALVDLKEADKALPFLEKSVDLKKNYSLAYQYLAQAHIALNNPKSAKSVLESGMHHAQENGDLMPLSEMKRLMTEISG